MENLTRIIIILATVFKATSSGDNSYTYQVFSGYHFEKQPHKIPYETTIPLLFTTQLIEKPEFSTFNRSLQQCEDNTANAKRYCQFQKSLITLQDLINTEIINRFPDTPENTTRLKIGSKKRRGLIFLEEFFSWCCNMASTKQVSGLYENQKNLESHTNEIVDSVSDQYKDLVRTTSNLNNFSSNVHGLIDKVHKTFYLVQDELNSIKTTSYSSVIKQLYNLTEQTWAYILYKYYLDKYREILDKCNQHRLSDLLATTKDLLLHLYDLNKKAKSKGLTLAISNNDLHLYYELKITTCKVFNNTLLVRINVPLITDEMNGVLYKSIATPLLWDNRICKLNMENKYIFKTRNYTKVITTEEACNDDSFPLCMLPRQTMVTTEEQLCLHLILSSASIDELHKHCKFTCDSKPQYPIITQLLPNKYLITNIDLQLKLSCDTDEHLINPISTGTLEMFIPCNCELSQQDLILLTKLKPCDSKDLGSPQIVNLIPAAWAKLRTLKLFPLTSGIKHEFDNLSEILDSNWTLNTPTFEVTALKKIEHIKLQNNEFDLFNNTKLMFYILLAWISLLSLLILIMGYCLHILTVRLKLMVPQRDYTSQTGNNSR